MFSLSALSPSYFYPVNVVLLNANGEPETHQFKACFLRYSTEELDALSNSVSQNDVSVIDMVKKVMTAWDGVTDEADTPLPFSPENLARLLQINGFGHAVISAFWKSCYPQSVDAALEKN